MVIDPKPLSQPLLRLSSGLRRVCDTTLNADEQSRRLALDLADRIQRLGEAYSAPDISVELQPTAEDEASRLGEHLDHLAHDLEVRVPAELSQTLSIVLPGLVRVLPGKVKIKPRRVLPGQVKVKPGERSATHQRAAETADEGEILDNARSIKRILDNLDDRGRPASTFDKA